MRGISLTLEVVQGGRLLATLRQDGATVALKSAPKDQVTDRGRALCLAVLRAGASAHQIDQQTFDFTHIRTNDAAKQALGI